MVWMVWMVVCLPPQSHMLKFKRQRKECFEVRHLGVIRSWRWSPHNGRSSNSAPPPFHLERTQQEGTGHEQEEGLHSNMIRLAASPQPSRPPELGQNISFPYKPFILWCFVTAAKSTKTYLKNHDKPVSKSWAWLSTWYLYKYVLQLLIYCKINSNYCHYYYFYNFLFKIITIKGEDILTN